MSKPVNALAVRAEMRPATEVMQEFADEGRIGDIKIGSGHMRQLRASYIKEVLIAGATAGTVALTGQMKEGVQTTAIGTHDRRMREAEESNLSEELRQQTCDAIHNDYVAEMNLVADAAEALRQVNQEFVAGVVNTPYYDVVEPSFAEAFDDEFNGERRLRERHGIVLSTKQTIVNRLSLGTYAHHLEREADRKRMRPAFR